jgi:hypothetical protein
MSKKHKERKGIDWNKVGKNLWHGIKVLDAAGKKEADWFFGADLKRAYEPDSNMLGSWDAEAEEFFAKKPKKDKREIIIVRA